MKRRAFVKYSVLALSTAGVAGVTAVNLLLEPYSTDLSLTGAIKLLSDLEQQLTLEPSRVLLGSGKWHPEQVFNHAAQSVEYSFSNGGYPEHKSVVFKDTVGAAAFALFSSNKAMTHNLSEPIPGAPELMVSGRNLSMVSDIEDVKTSNQKTLVALMRLKQSLLDFKQFDGVLHPHFAYGDLTKAEYELAHVMHLHNHLSEIYFA